jgi:broad specificity phosphatase PhoE/CTP:molybdopterin cytidylyltransferase MocA
MIGGLILAAGYSSRMGDFKPLLKVGGLSSLTRVIRALKTAGAEETAIVTGYKSGLLKENILNEGTTEIFNPDYDCGMFSSVKAGIKYFSQKGAAGVLLIPADYPLVPAAAIGKLLKEAKPDSFAVPVYEGKKGHPLWIPSFFFDEILNHNGDMGLKGVTRRYDDSLIRVRVPYEGVILDMDETTDYEKILSIGVGSDLNKLSSGRRFILLRHGETARHADRVFIGSYDVPLSPEGLIQAEKAAEDIRKLEPTTRKIYCGSLSRAKATAMKLSESLHLPLCIKPEFNEMSLGGWDGRLIEEIKNKYPNEYEQRGKELLAYKSDSQAENFYDLQYRTVECLKTILIDDDSRDIIIVSHSGVIKCLYGALMGHDIDWSYSRCNVKKGECITVNGV